MMGKLRVLPSVKPMIRKERTLCASIIWGRGLMKLLLNKKKSVSFARSL